jgi:L-fucose isomerase
MDITEAFLNDPYDWEGPKQPHVCATESDMDGALTMQLLKGLTGTPVLFADVRHYHADRDIWDLCNSGQHATWYAARSDDPAENLRSVNFYPEIFYFPAGGASVSFFAAPGQATFRLEVEADEFLSEFGANHIHAVPGDHVAELRAVCRLLGIEWAGLGDAHAGTAR